MSANKKDPQFRNPLLQPTTAGVPPMDAAPALEAVAPRPKRQSEFEASHERLTVWVHGEIKARFEALCQQRGRGAKTQLINEALTDLLKKHKVA